MSIRNDKTKVTIEFMWEPDSKGNTRLDNEIYQIKHHYTDDFGPTVSISSNDDKDSYYAFPAQMLLDAVEYLVQEGVFGNHKVAKSNEVVDVVAKPVLPMPVVSSSANLPQKSDTFVPAEHTELTGPPIQKFSGEVAEEPEPEDVEESRPTVDDKEASEMAEERRVAVSKSDTNTGSVKRC